MTVDDIYERAFFQEDGVWPERANESFNYDLEQMKDREEKRELILSVTDINEAIELVKSTSEIQLAVLSAQKEILVRLTDMHDYLKKTG